MNKNHYELVITVQNADGGKRTSKKTIADPFNSDEEKEQSKIDKFAKSAAKSVAIRSGVAIVRSYTQTLGNSQLQEQIDAVQSGVNFVTQTVVATASMGPVGLAMSLLSTLPQITGKLISYSNGKTWDNISTNKALRRAGVEYNRSRD